jgi:hypothetical protein
MLPRRDPDFPGVVYLGRMRHYWENEIYAYVARRAARSEG